MELWAVKLDTLWEQMRASLIKKIKEIGVESKDYNFKVIKVDDERAFNLDGDKYLVEIGKDNLIDNEGYLYSYGQLDHEQLAELTDWAEQLK